MSSYFSKKLKPKSKDSRRSTDSKDHLTGRVAISASSSGGHLTHAAEIGNMGRTHFEGVMTPEEHRNVGHLNTVVPFMNHPSVAPTFTNAGADMGTKYPAAKKSSSSVKAPSDMLPRFAISQYADDSRNSCVNVGPHQASKNSHLGSMYEPTLPMVPEYNQDNRPSGNTTRTEFYNPDFKVTNASRRPPASLLSSKDSTIKLQHYNQPSSGTQIYNPLPKIDHRQPSSLPHINIIQATQPRSSHGPITTASIFTNPKDQHMASLQPSINLMPPSSSARKAQDKWVQSTISKLAASTCPEGNKFTRVPPSSTSPGGYQCSGGRHFLTDTLIASGSPGIYYLLDPSDPSYLSGPYYPCSTDTSTLLYSGPEPKSPPHAPDWIQGSYKGNFNAKTRERESVRVGRTVLGRASDRDVVNIAEGLGVKGVGAKEARERCEEFVNSKG